MLFSRAKLKALAMAIFGCAVASAATSEVPPPSCSVTTQQSVFIPPAPYPSAPSSGFYFGTEKLWTELSSSVWHNLPKWPAGYRQKIVWWTKDFDAKESARRFAISGRRLDGSEVFYTTEANPSRRPDMGPFIMSGILIPVAGCWEITGHLGENHLRFVVWITG